MLRAKNSQLGWLELQNTLTTYLLMGKTPPPNKCPEYDTKQSDSKAPLMLELWGIWSIPSLPSLSAPLWPRMVAPDRVLSMSQIELVDI